MKDHQKSGMTILGRYREALRLFFSNILLLSAIIFTLWLPVSLLITFVENSPLVPVESREGIANQVAATANIFAPISVGALIYALSRIRKGSSPAYVEALTIGLRSWGKLLAARFCANVLIAGGFILFIVPGIILLIRYALLEPAVIVEGAGINESRRTSMRLTRGMSWQILRAGIIFSGVFFVLLFFVLLLHLMIASISEVLATMVAYCIGYLARYLALAIFTIVLFDLYLEARAAEENSGESRSRPQFSPVPVRERLAYFAIVAIAVLFSFMPTLRWVVADWSDVPTGSMKPTILEGDRILINKAAYGLRVPFTRTHLMQWQDPSWGDVVIVRSPEDGKVLVERVVGLPGDVIEIRRNRLYRNGEPAVYGPLQDDFDDYLDIGLPAALLTESVGGREHPIMILGRGLHPPGPFYVPEGKFFVMGDNRNNSRDSRYFGPVDRSQILGEATAVALSLDPANGYRPRWGRFFSRLP